MPRRAYCPHCIRECEIAEKHLSVPVRCHNCGKVFTVKPTALAGNPPSTEPTPPGATEEADTAVKFIFPYSDGLVAPAAVYPDRSTAKLGLLALALALGVVSLAVVALLVASRLAQ